MAVSDTELLIGQAFRATAGISQLALHGGAQVARLAADVHAAIVGSALPMLVQRPLPYRIVGGVFSVLGSAAALLPRVDDSRSAPDHWRRFVSVLNGVAGDTLAETGNALAIDMSVRDAAGHALEPAGWRSGSRGAVLFVHGLCCSEVEWRTPAHCAFVADLETAGYSVGWLRYNSGRSIAENGRDLAALLDGAAGDTAGELVLIGHSMGGLVIRSACHTAAALQQPWLARLTHAAYLGSPHHGAPLERAGNLANALLGITAYSAPFMRLGNVRSRGIKDLRFGCVTAEESAAAGEGCYADTRRSIAALPAHVRHLLVAASLKPRSRNTWIGDGLVPVASALGQHRDGHLSLQAPSLERRQLSPLNHLALMGDAGTYTALRDWLL